jgi:hypothetical protein
LHLLHLLHLLYRLHWLHDELLARILEHHWSEGSVLSDLGFLLIISASEIIVLASFLSVHMDGDVGRPREGSFEGLVCSIFSKNAFECLSKDG